MFKKIFFLFIFSFLLYIGYLNIFTKANDYLNTIYLKVGCSEDVLNIKDCIIIGGDINLDCEGEYDIVYFNVVTKYSFNIKYIVVSNRDISYYDKVLDLKKVKDDSYFSSIISKDGVNIVSSYYYDHSKLNSLNDKRSIINVFVGEKLLSTNLFSYYCEVVKLIFSEAGFIALINYDEEGKTHFEICEYSMDGSLLRSKQIKSNATDKAKDIYIVDEYLYVIFNSSSTTAPFISKYSGVSCAFLAKINYYNLEVEDYVSFGNNTSNNILDCLWYDNHFYIFFKPFGSGDFLKKLSGSKFVVKYDTDLKQIKYLEIDNDDGYFGVAIANNKLCIFTSFSQLSNKIKATFIDLELKKEDEKEIYIDNPYYTVDKICAPCTNNTDVLVINGRSNIDNKISILGILKVNGDDLIYQNYYLENDKCLYLDINLNDIIIYIAGENDVLILNYYHLECEENNYKLNNNDVNYDEIFDTYLDDKIYGLNEKTIKISFGNSCYYEKINYFMDLNCSVIDGEIYDKGVEIYTNGMAYLNDKLINNGYKINQEGDYLLKIYGRFDATTYLEIKIKTLTNKLEKASLNQKSVVKISDIEESNYQVGYVKVEDIEAYIDNKKTTSSPLSISIIIALLIIGSSIFIPFGKKKVGKNG